jgi:dCTP deaminase
MFVLYLRINRKRISPSLLVTYRADSEYLMFLCDFEIKKLPISVISPYHSDRLQPASYDLSLAGEFLIPRSVNFDEGMDLRIHNPGDFMDKVLLTDDPDSFIVIGPNQCVLGCTEEIISCPPDISVDVVGKSSYARIFLVPHLEAGFCDPGFSGQVTLEIKNNGPWNIKLYKGMRIAQAKFIRHSKCETPYGSKDLGSHYYGQMGPTASAGKRGNE